MFVLLAPAQPLWVLRPHTSPRRRALYLSAQASKLPPMVTVSHVPLPVIFQSTNPTMMGTYISQSKNTLQLRALRLSHIPPPTAAANRTHCAVAIATPSATSTRLAAYNGGSIYRENQSFARNIGAKIATMSNGTNQGCSLCQTVVGVVGAERAAYRFSKQSRHSSSVPGKSQPHVGQLAMLGQML